MDDFPGILARDFGFKPQGKSAPMAPSRNSNSNSNSNYSSSSNYGLGSEFTKSSSLNSSAVFEDHQDDHDGRLFNDVFGGPPKYSSTSAVDSRGGGSTASSFDYDSIFRDQSSSKSQQNSKPTSNSMPVFDKPVYDDDIFEGLPGLRSSSTPAGSSTAKLDDVFAAIASTPKQQRSARESSPFDDLLGDLGKKENESRVKPEKDASAFDDLLPGFGRSSSPISNRSTSETSWSQKPPSNSTKNTSSVLEEPFVVLESTSTPMGSSSEVFPDPLDEISQFSGSGSARLNVSSMSGVFDDLDPLTNLGKSVPPVSSEVNNRGKDRSPLRSKSMSGTQTHPMKESIYRSSGENAEGYVHNRTPADSFQESNETFFGMPTVSTDSHRSAGRATSPPSYTSGSPNETNSQVNTTPKLEILESADDVWLTVSEIPLFTQPTRAPPPSRPPPPRPTRVAKSETGAYSSANARKKANEYSSFSVPSRYTDSPKTGHAASRSSADELEDFASSRSWNNVNEYGEVPSGEDMESSVAAASAAAMKEAMDRAEAKFRHAKEMRERESSKAGRSRESVQLDKDERATQDAQERLDHERHQREREEEELRRLERERERAREIEREREEKEREQRRLEKERERAREMEKEREKARQAVERATREARERAATEARLKAERAAVEKANAAARERAERAAVQRAQAEARERAAAEARERAERAAAEARERANAEAREKEARERATAAKTETEARLRAERAAVERAAAEARERAAAEARERAAAAARANQNQQKNDNDLESFFSSRPSSAPRPRANSSDPLFDTQNKGGPDTARRTSTGVSSSMKKASSTTNIVDDLSSIFGAAGSSAGEFQEFEGETEERRRARLERHQRTQERAAKALAEKNQRDLQAQREQAERHRIAETLDVEIKRWAAGKEGNIRALLATLQYVLWPECGWQPVSLTDLITAAAVKKVYRKATLCIHPDKVQQKGANLQQKYIAEKVFDLLKEAWNKFNSEELF